MPFKSEYSLRRTPRKRLQDAARKVGKLARAAKAMEKPQESMEQLAERISRVSLAADVDVDADAGVDMPALVSNLAPVLTKIVLKTFRWNGEGRLVPVRDTCLEVDIMYTRWEDIASRLSGTFLMPYVIGTRKPGADIKKTPWIYTPLTGRCL